MDPFKQKLNAAEIIFILFFTLLIVILAISLPKQYSWVTSSLGSAFGLFVVQGYRNKQEREKHPTIDDIKRKYPKRKSQEGIRSEAFLKAADQSEQHPSFLMLLRMVGGDKDTARGLIAGDLKKGVSINDACDNAIYWLERDRR